MCCKVNGLTISGNGPENYLSYDGLHKIQHLYALRIAVCTQNNKALVQEDS
jgi:hypothetical protein